jgi:hypothetical protein
MAYNNEQNRGRQDNDAPPRANYAIPNLTLTAEQLAELEAMTNREGFTPIDRLDLQMMAEQVGQARYADFRLFVRRCSSLGISPLDNEIHMEYKSAQGAPKAVFTVHVDGWRKIVDKTGELDGFEQVTGADENGSYIDTIVWRKGRSHPFRSRVYRGEFKGQLHGTMPMHMLGKSGEVLGLKRAFPVSGVLSEGDNDNWQEGDAPEPQPTTTQPQPDEKATQVIDGYTVASTKPVETPKPTEKTEAPVETKKAEPPPEDPKKKEYQTLIADILAMGITKPELKSFTEGYLEAAKVKKLDDPEKYLELYRNTLAILRRAAHHVDLFKENPAAAGKSLYNRADKAPEPTAETPVDPILTAAREGVSAKFPTWSPELLKLGSYWCVDRMQSADNLDALLIASGMSTAPPGRVEAYLAIMRNITPGSSPALLAFARRTQLTMSEIEDDIAKGVGFSLRAPETTQKAVLAWLQENAAEEFPKRT